MGFTHKSRLSPRAIERHQRRAKALQLRSTGASFQAISEELGISVPTAFRDVERAVKDLVPPETASQVVTMDIARFDAMITKYYPLALDGDEKSAELVLKIFHQRARLLGLYPADGQPSLHFHAHSENAETAGIKVEFVTPDPKVLEANPIPTSWNPPPLRQIGPPMPDYRFVADSEPPPGVAVKATTTAQPAIADQFVNPVPPHEDLRPKTLRERREALKERAIAEGIAGGYGPEGTAVPKKGKLHWMS